MSGVDFDFKGVVYPVAYLPLQRGTAVTVSHPTLARYQEDLEEGAHAMWAAGSVQRRFVETAQETYDLYFLPVSSSAGMVFVFDITGIKRLVESYEMNLDQVYRDVFYAATGGRLVLVSPCDIPQWSAPAQSTWSVPIRTPTDIDRCRHLTKKCLEAEGVERKQALEVVLSVSEAVTNALKHAHGGEFSLRRTAAGWELMVTDQGPGIDRNVLPQATLMPGFSTKSSLGLGFTAILRSMDRVVMSSSQVGVTLLMQKSVPTSSGGVLDG